MANTYVDYTATAGQTDFAFNFPYLEDEHIKVYINSIEKLQSDFSISTSPATKIVLNVPATGGETVRVRRKSQPNDDLVDFVNGSVLTESELDRGYRHTRYLAEEASEFASVSLELEGVLSGSQIEDGTVSTTKITDGAITEGKLAVGAVTTAKLGADAVNGTKIADDSIDSEHYVDGSIDTAHIADNQITAAKISSSDTTFNIKPTGEVSIGTASPLNGAELTINGVMILSNYDADVVQGTVLGRCFFAGRKPSGVMDTGAAIIARGAGTATNSNNDVPCELSFYTNAGGLAPLQERLIIDKDGNVFIGNTEQTPSTPSGGGYLYVENGALKYRGSSGTVTTLGLA